MEFNRVSKRIVIKLEKTSLEAKEVSTVEDMVA